MTTRAITQAVKRKKPAIIRERGAPRYVLLDWNTYRAWEEMSGDLEDHIRFDIALRESKGKRRYTFAEIKRKYRLP